MKKGDKVIHRSAFDGEEEKGEVIKIEQTPSGDSVVEMRRDDGTTHRDYATYFK